MRLLRLTHDIAGAAGHDPDAILAGYRCVETGDTGCGSGIHTVCTSPC